MPSSGEFDATAAVVAGLRLHGAALRRYVAARVAPGEVDDILQLGAIRAIEKADQLRDASSLLPWLYRVHRTVLTGALRRMARERRLREAVAAEPAPVSFEEEEPICGCALALSRKLGERYATILGLVDVSGVSLSSAAETLGISVNNATVRLHRARAALKQRLFDHCGVASTRQCLDCRCEADGRHAS